MSPLRFLRMLLILVLVSTGLIACGKDKDKNAESDVIVKAYRLIDEQRTDEAIQLLEDELRRTPENYHLKVVLSSAYAHRAGIKMQTLFPAMRELRKIKGFGKKSSSTPRRPGDPRPPQNTIAVLAIAKLMNQYAGVIEAFTSIPTVNASQRQSLEHAINLLGRLDSDILPEDAIYRAVLRVVLFKNTVTQNLMGDVPSASTGTCRVDFGSAGDTIVTLGRLLVDIYVDVAIANPKNRKDLERRSTQVTEVTEAMTSTLAGFSMADEATRMFMSEALIENGFGRLIKCTGS